MNQSDFALLGQPESVILYVPCDLDGTYLLNIGMSLYFAIGDNKQPFDFGYECQLGDCKLLDKNVSPTQVEFTTCRDFFQDGNWHAKQNYILLVIKRNDVFIKSGTMCIIKKKKQSFIHKLASVFESIATMME